MARTVRDANLETRTARLRLPIRSEPYWRGLEKGFALGYRRRSKGGTWLARRRPAAGGYAEHKIGTSDDLQDADGVAILDYGQAQRAARAWWRAELRREEGHDTRSGPCTVADAIADYLKEFEGRGGKSVYHTRRAAETHILPALGTALVGKLTAKKIEDWHRGLAVKAGARPLQARSQAEPPQGRQERRRRAQAPRHREPNPDGPESRAESCLEIRPRRERRCLAPREAVPGGRNGPHPLSLRGRMRAAGQRCEPAFRNLVRGALLTGCRYSELTNMHVADFNADAGVVTVRESKAGKPRHVVLTDEGRQLFATLTAGKLGNDAIFTRALMAACGASRTNCGRCWKPAQRAKIKPAISFPCASAHTWLDARHARRADGRHRRATGPCRHADDRKALRASCAELRRRHDPRAFPDSRYWW